VVVYNKLHVKQENPAVARESALYSLCSSCCSTDFQDHPKFDLIWKGVCDFILVINSNLRHRAYILHRLAIIAHTDLQDHPMPMIFFMSFESQYATSH